VRSYEAENETLQASIKGKEELTKGKEEQEQKAQMEPEESWAPMPDPRMSNLVSSGLSACVTLNSRIVPSDAACVMSSLNNFS
jgi:hypothetical protein